MRHKLVINSRNVLRFKNRFLYRRFCTNSSVNENNIPPIPKKELYRQFCAAAIPMVGFGFIDNTVMIRAGDYIDNSFGQIFAISTLTAAAFGQVCSDSCGVIFGNTLDALFNKVGMKPPNISPLQRTLRSP
eukprot:UN02190